MIVEQILIVTNNPMSRENFEVKHALEFVEGNTLAVFTRVRDYIHKGHRLLTHPLMSSIKPNATPYRTVVIVKKADKEMDMKSLTFIEEGIHTTEKFLKDYGIRQWSDSILDDFQVIDYDLIYHAIT